MLSRDLLGITFPAVGVKARQSTDPPHCYATTRGVGRVKSPTLLSKYCCHSFVHNYSELIVIFFHHRYLTKISVYDKSEQATFVLLGDAGKELTGKHAAELVANYFEVISDCLYIITGK